MKNSDFIRALNQIHLEASLLEAIMCQMIAKADENNLDALRSAMAIANRYVLLADEESIQKRISEIATQFCGLCGEVTKDPSLLEPFPSLLNVTFHIVAHDVHFYLPEKELDKTMLAMVKMLAKVDHLIPDYEFQGFIQLFYTFDCCFEEVVKIPRIAGQIDKFLKENLQQIPKPTVSKGKSRGKTNGSNGGGGQLLN